MSEDLLRLVREVLSAVRVTHRPEPYEFQAHAELTGVRIRFVSWRACNTTGHYGQQPGRWFFIDGVPSDKAIVRTALLAVLTFEEHEIREGFKYKGKALYEPDHA